MDKKIDSVLIRGRDSKIFLTKSEFGITVTVQMVHKMQIYGFSQLLAKSDVKEIMDLLATSENKKL